jgi:MFS family permease
MKVLGPWIAFGAYWGVWGASVPAIRDQAGVDDGRLGVALLLIGFGAMPAMAFTGRAVDRYGPRVAALTILLLGLAGVALALGARGYAGLAAGLLLVGAVSGMADVAINALSAEAQQSTGRPVIARSHATFSAAVVGASVLTGLLGAAGAPVVLPFAVVLAVAVAAGYVVIRGSGPISAGPISAGPVSTGPVSAEAGGVCGPGLSRALPFLPLILIGMVAALGFAVENAHQSWSAVFLHDILKAGTGLSAAAPAVFAGVTSVTRFAIGDLGSRRPAALLITGATAAAAGTLTVALAGQLAVALAGLAVAAAGTAVLYPTLIGAVLAEVHETHRGRATSRVATTAYLGFLAGPVYVGLIAGHSGLRAALCAVAVLAAMFALLAPPAVRHSRRRLTATPAEVRA